MTFNQDTDAVAKTRDSRQSEPSEDVIAVFDRVARLRPHATAVTSLHQRDALGIGTRRWTYSELRDGSIRLAKRFVEAGMRKGSRIAAFVPNNAEWALLFLASARAGCAFAPVDPRVLGDTAGSDGSYLLREIRADCVVVSDGDMADAVDRMILAGDVPSVAMKLIVTCGRDDDRLSRQAWDSLQTIMTIDDDGRDFQQPQDPSLPTLHRDDIILVLCTSGTTSRPKLCPHSSVTIATPALAVADHLALTPRDTLCQHLPPFHVFYVAMTLAFWVAGGAVTIPSARFSPSATFAAIGSASASSSRAWVAAVPTMIYAMEMHAEAVGDGGKLASPYGIVLGGAPIPHRALYKSRALGAKSITAGYGTTEGVATLFNVMESSDARIVVEPPGARSDDTCLGTATAGAHLRICAPGSRKPLGRNQTGELHQGGFPVVNGYLGATEEQNGAAFYREGSVLWFATGDQGYMDDAGNIYLLGRYKDVIIRAGENIPPLKIELVLSGQPGVASAVVVGMPDGVSGEVPVAVVKTKGAGRHRGKAYLNGLKVAVLKDLGRSFAPTLILDLKHDLGRDEYPVTTTGKVRKNVVQGWVAEYLRLQAGQAISSNNNNNNARSSQHRPGTPSSLPRLGASDADSAVSQLTSLWSSVSGLDAKEIHPDQSVRTFVDSTMMIQFLAKARGRGAAITLKQLLASDTINKQVPLFKAESSGGENMLASPLPLPSSPSSPSPTVERSVDADRVKIAAIIGRHANEIEQVLPMTDTFRVSTRIQQHPGAWTHRIAFMVQRPMEADRVLSVVETWLGLHPILRSVVALPDNDEPAVYAVLRPQRPWLDSQVVRGREVEDEEAVKAYDEDDFIDLEAAAPLCKVTVLPLRSRDSEPRRCGLIILMHHAAFDGHCAVRWIRELNDLLGDQLPLPWVPFHQYAAAYEHYRHSRGAQESVDYFVRKMSGVSAARDAIWDVRRVMEKMPPTELGPAPPFSSTDSSRWTDLGLLPRRRVRLPHLTRMRSRFGISAPIIALAACAILNVRHTGAREAIFFNFQSGRSWPGEDDRNDAVYDHPKQIAMSPFEIDGPTLARVPSRVPVDMERDTALDLLLRARNEQDEMMLHAHAPLARIFEGIADAQGPRRTLTATSGAATGARLPDDAGGDDDDCTVLRRLMTDQSFDWLLEPFENRAGAPLKSLRRTSLSPSGWVWLPGLKRMEGGGDSGIGDDGKGNGNGDDDDWAMYMKLYYSDPDLPFAKSDALSCEFLRCAAWLSDPANMGKKLGESGLVLETILIQA